MSNAILIIEDETILAKNMRTYLERNEYEVECAESAEDGIARLERFAPDAVVLDFNLPGMDGLQALERIRAQCPGTPVIMVTGHGSVETAVEAMKAGALDFLTKPVPLAKLGMLLQRATSERRKDSALAYYRQRDGEGADLSTLRGESPGMQRLHGLLRQLLRSEEQLRDGEAPAVLVRGETGTGKELVARALHDYGKRRNGPFVAINMAAIPRELIESELFGHEKGAFTGAANRYAGRFEQAEGGTLFLDEIGDMPMDAQTRLLRVLQQGEYTTVGGRTPIRTDVRIVAATNRDLRQAVNQGLFREDLFYRLNVVPLRLPPLRERSEDIADLVRHFLNQATAQGLPTKTVSAEAMERIRRYRWPGNVRELENLVRRLAALYADDVIGLEVIENELAEPPQAPRNAEPSEEETLTGSIERHLTKYFSAQGDDLPPPGLYDRMLRELEIPLISLSLAATRGNQIKAAHMLGLNRNTLRKKIRDHNIQVIRGLK